MEERSLSTLYKGLQEHSGRTPLQDALAFADPHIVWETALPGLRESLLQEKLMVHFETPYRALVRGEFTFSVTESLRTGDSRTALFLFSLRHGVGWLKLSLDGERLHACSRAQKRRRLADALRASRRKRSLPVAEDPLAKLSEARLKELTVSPVVVALPDDIRPGTHIIEFEYCDAPKKHANGWCIIDQPTISIDIMPKSPRCTLWLYAKSPDGFDIRLIDGFDAMHTATSREAEVLEHADDQVVSRSYRRQTSSVDDTASADPCIKVHVRLRMPATTYWWLVGFLAMGLIGALSVIGSVIAMAIYLRPGDTLSWLDLQSGRSVAIGRALEPGGWLHAFVKDGADTICIALLAVIVAARAWLIHEDTAHKRVSAAFAVTALLLVVASWLSFVAQ